MSYVNMDHAGWVQRNIEASKRRPPIAKERRALAEHKGWHAAPDVLTPFQVRAFNVLGIVGGGIYNCPIAWSGVHWWPKQIILPWGLKGFATYDFNELTKLCFLAHDARIRAYIGSRAAPRHLELSLSERQPEGGMSGRHPNLQEAVDYHRSWMPLDHSIVYPGDRSNSLMDQIKAALHRYHHALDHRQNGDIAAHACVRQLETILQTPWMQGATLCKEEPAKADATS